MFLSETLPVVVIETLEKVDNSESSVFSELIEIAGLDPSVDLIGANFSNCDFRGSNLSGYNFSKCEMLNCIKDETTVISPQTVFPPEATWLTERQIQVHERMLAIQSTEGTQRKRLVKQLIEEVGETRHTRAFLISQAKKATSWSELFDYLDFLTDFPTEADELKVKDKLHELIQKSFRQRRSQSSSKRGAKYGYQTSLHVWKYPLTRSLRTYLRFTKKLRVQTWKGLILHSESIKVTPVNSLCC